eukprot:XP_019919918.1 PREDICTED: uncharacterized protein LOC109617712 [Crassostrea gigas]
MLLDMPEVIKTFNTGYKEFRSISFHSEENIWTSARIKDIKCFSADGNFIKTISTESGILPNDIAVTSAGDLVYCDFKLKTLNKLKNEQSEEIIVLQLWTPVNLCVTSTGDFLVSMFNDDNTQSKVVRYLESTEKQTIQFDDENKPLYSGNAFIKYLTENGANDICVADYKAGAVVAVDLNGKLRWRYTGHPSGAKKNPFKPHGITANSQIQILTADNDNNCIHILDQDGQFLRYIGNTRNPLGLYVDKLDNLYVAEYNTGDVKVIRYLK